MSKERLEEIKKIIENHKSWAKGTHYAEINYEELNEIDWLIEQAERLHGTKHKLGYIDMYADCNRIVGSNSMKIHKLEQQNKRYREAYKNAKYEYISLAPYGAEMQRDRMLQEINKALEGEE